MSPAERLKQTPTGSDSLKVAEESIVPSKIVAFVAVSHTPLSQLLEQFDKNIDFSLAITMGGKVTVGVPVSTMQFLVLIISCRKRKMKNEKRNNPMLAAIN
jgi:hypothetical protein